MDEKMKIIQDGRELRCGYTTGSSAAAASKAAGLLLEGKDPLYVTIETPAGIDLKIPVMKKKIVGNKALASVIKDAGDDPDVTDGIEIIAFVSKRNDGKIRIDGGKGVGRYKKDGLFGKVDEPAINPVPREMISHELRKLSDSGYDVTIEVPLGETIAKKTYNKKLGIIGGISIIGTKGIVYPMSEDAILKTIYMEIDMIKKEKGLGRILLVPGNYGEKLARAMYPDQDIVKISNFFGDSLKYVASQGFKEVIILGHIGKLSKLSLGIFNTHSRYADTRIEAFVYYLSLMGAEASFIKKVNQAITAEEALGLCIDRGYGEVAYEMENGAKSRIKSYLKDPNIDLEVIIYSMERGVVNDSSRSWSRES